MGLTVLAATLRTLSARCSGIAAAIMFSGLTAACLTDVTKQASLGQHDAIAADSRASELTEYEPYDHYLICEAFYHLQEFTRLDDCLKTLWPRTESEEFGVGVVTFDRNYVDLLVSSLEARRYLDLGDVVKARGFAERSLAASAQSPRMIYNELLSAYTSIFTFGLNNINSEDSAQSIFVRNITQAEANGLMAVVEQLSGDDAEAEKYRVSLRSIYKSAPKNNESGYALNKIRFWLARSYYLAEDYGNAYDILTRDDRTGSQQALDAVGDAILFIGKPVSEPISIAVTGATTDEVNFYQNLPVEVMLVRSAYQSGKLDVAAPGYDELLSDERIANFSNLYFRLLHERALIDRQWGNTVAAEKRLKQAIIVLEDQRASIDREDYRMGFVGDKVDVYGDMVDLLIAGLNNEQAFEYTERAKARALVDMLASRKDFATAEQQNAAELVRLLDELDTESNAIKSQDTNSSGVRSARKTELRQALTTTAPELASLVTVGEIDRQAIQSHLEDDEVLLEYYGVNDTLYAFIVTRDHVETVSLDGRDLSQNVAALRDAVGASKSRAHVRSTRRMYDRLIRPLEDKLTGATLTVVPHGPLHYLPFAALNDGERYLIDRFDIRLLPSASVLQFLNKTIDSSQDLLALGNPDLNNPDSDLPGAERETRVIDEGRAGSRILLRKLASEANFKKFAPSFRYLHLASHGEFNDKYPLKSRMLLAPGENEDGNLTVDELYSLRLNAELVTLSACETGLGDIKSGDDVVGLTRGFMYAGAQSIVSSLWPVADDATAYLMKNFYANLLVMPKASALRGALIATKDRYEHPIYWSAFNLTGALR